MKEDVTTITKAINQASKLRKDRHSVPTPCFVGAALPAQLCWTNRVYIAGPLQ